jgi:hypothetical protein
MTSEASALTTTAMQTDVLDRLITGVSPLLDVSWTMVVVNYRVEDSDVRPRCKCHWQLSAPRVDGASENEVGVYFGSVR